MRFKIISVSIMILLASQAWGLDKGLPKYDLEHRYPGYTFTETPVGDMFLVEFEDELSAVTAAAQCMVLPDAYMQIRRQMDILDDVAFCLSSTERDLLTTCIGGDAIFNYTTNQIEVYHDSIWVAVADRFRCPVVFVKNSNLLTGAYMVLGEVITSDTSGWIVPQDLTLETVTISRSDSDAADLEIMCNGLVGVTVPTSATETVVTGESALCEQGDIISIRNKTGGATMSDTICTLWFGGNI